MGKGWIKLHRKITEWEWYGDHNTTRLFIHLLATANYKDTKWQGRVIKRGQRVIGRMALAEEVGLSEQTIRTCLIRLKSTSEITTKSTNRFTVLTLENYDYYQSEEQSLTSQITAELTSKQPASNQQLTTSKEVKKVRKKEIYKNSDFKQINSKQVSQGKAIKCSAIEQLTDRSWFVDDKGKAK